MSELETKSRPWWQRIPLYLQILIALILAVVLGTVSALIDGKKPKEKDEEILLS